MPKRSCHVVWLRKVVTASSCIPCSICKLRSRLAFLSRRDAPGSTQFDDPELELVPALIVCISTEVVVVVVGAKLSVASASLSPSEI